MKKIYKIKFPKIVYILCAVVVLALIAAIVLNFVELSRWKAEEFAGLALNVLSTVMMLVIIGVTLSLVFLSRYTLREDDLKINFSFIFMKISCGNIKMIRTNPEKTIYLLYYLVYNKKEADYKLTYLRLNIENPEDFIDALTRKNPEIVYDIFDKEKSDAPADRQQ